MSSQRIAIQIIRFIPLPLVLVFFLQACKTPPVEAEQQPLARVYDYVLFWDDVKDFLPDNADSKDSAQIINGAINKWVNHALKLRLAEKNLTPEQKDLHREIEEYRSSLLIYKYEQEYINQKLDTAISHNDIQDYYDGFKPEFVLDKPVVLCDFVVIDAEAPRYSTFKNWFRYNYEAKLDDINAWCEENAEVYFHHNNNYLYFDDLAKRIPLTTDNPDNFLKYNKFTEIKKGNKRYLVKFFDYKLKSEIAPLNIVKNNIRSILLNKRKLELIRDLDANIMNEALRSKHIEINSKK